MRLLALVAGLACAAGFLPAGPARLRPARALRLRALSSSMDRRQALSTAAVTAASALALLRAGPASAATDRGPETGLPDGARQFNNLVGAQRQWSSIGARVRDKAAEMSGDEWDGLQQFLRAMYRVGDEDMVYLANNLGDEAKRKRGKEIAGLVKDKVKGADKLVITRDAKAVVEVQQAVDALIKEFFELRQDVPDEL